MKTNSGHAYTNKLIDETSPYLLQHAHNPVNWHPWGEEALQKAKDENKLLIISIGYAACHWCHVMEHESFEDSLVADIMNKHFVPIKVDREERPDVDDVYMTACQLVSGRGGWPLNAFAMPDGRPIWAGTYFPKDQWTNILNQFAQLNENEPQKLEESANQLTAGLKAQDLLEKIEDDAPFAEENLNAIGDAFLKQIDLIEGGRRGAPKFPMPNNYEFLLKYHHASKNKTAYEAVLTTLDKMAMGGIYDQLGGGFARYSVDAYWKVPHFEKMLYDNGQLVSLYSQAYKHTKKELYKDIVEQTLDFIAREMTSKEGGFYSSLDADSEGEEGKFYVWGYSEIEEILGDPDAFDIFQKYYNLQEFGNWEEGKNILLRKLSDATFCKQNDISAEELSKTLAVSKEKLMKARDRRIRPGLDDKILSSWNALMLKGYIHAYQALQKPEYLKVALDNANFLVEHQISSDSRVNRNYKNGKSSINGFLDDYALQIDAFIELYQVTFDEKWLTQAQELTEYTRSYFFNEENAMFFYTSSLDPALVTRKMENMDNVIPASNSVMANNLQKLGELLYNDEYLAISRQMLKNMEPSILDSGAPSFYSNWCQLYQNMVYPPYEIAIVGEHSAELRDQMIQSYIPNAVYLGGTTEGSLELLKNKLNPDATLIYVCQNKSCKFPVDSPQKAIELID